MLYWLFNRDPYVMVYDIILIYLGRISSPIFLKQAYLLFVSHVVFSTGGYGRMY